MPPAATTGIDTASTQRRHGVDTASTTCGTSENVPTNDSPTGRRNALRCPPASLPEATTRFSPVASTATASSTVVAVPISRMPWRCSSSTKDRGGNPVTKLITGGAAASRASS
jgi:hypothetical protein